MTVRRTLAALTVVAVTVLLDAAPAAAHGAPTSPLSRSAACGPQGPHVSTPACRAAVSAGAALREWDNIRVYGVAGRDRERIPDGELCSGGLSAYRGLDLARADWPATELTAGAKYVFRYRGTIPHKGTFRLYTTRPGYDPQTRLRWADLDTIPFLSVTDPPLRDGSYQIPGRLPAGLTGRHLIYTVWQNSDTPDTYYSCSDVLFRPAAGVLAASPADAAAATSSPVPGGAATTGADPAPADSADAASDVDGSVGAGEEAGVPVASVTRVGGGDLRLVVGAAVVLTVLVVALVATRLRRPAPVPPGRPCGVRNHRAGRRRIW
ncbi:lytic polysaccharide monooxygenase auxiliary activity family 9 protein [Micromonospora rifamycinica]|uniref:Chitin-binding protein n=1 Tax=Micromonospora rifamycinica TaxID=291594 RepID=A0A120FA16_9ACTN|nr:lytic polysaccharide monooxygenase [Micromonospora rifamycinica]KWV34174.1 chitin-binding protein [Micromonospora rifamycinica]SCG58555.1 chitin-binding protein [Micromonospora rifamycinica]